MPKTLGMVLICLMPAQAWTTNALTMTETRWLAAGSAVLDFADRQKLPLDIIVQPQSSPGNTPIAMGFDDGRCKLVLSLRGNPDAEAPLTTLEPDLQNTAIEAMMAHELAHCWRHVNGAWHTIPVSFVDARNPGHKRTHAGSALDQEMEQTRREEGFADLFGLAWTAQHHPAQYGRVYGWLKQVREEEVIPGSHHDTRKWISLAADPTVFAAHRTPFEQVQAIWAHGLER